MVTTKTIHVHTLILGGGMTGLSTAYALEQQGWHDYVVLESKNQAGGLCASTQQNGYRFDFGGHLLHLHTKTGKHLVQTLLKNN